MRNLEEKTMDWSRRDVCAALPAFLALSSLGAQEKATIQSKIYQFDELTARESGSLISRNIVSGKIFEGCQISLHESDLAPHSIPHPPHRHLHEEMVLVLEGTLEFTINGVPARAGSGSILFAGSNDLHGIRNPEDTHAKYFVFALGPENK
jgi:mannose-6-phosphate isomerase-like protein (cupin superfamily)